MIFNHLAFIYFQNMLWQMCEYLRILKISLKTQMRVTRSSPSWVRVRPRVAVADVGGHAEFHCEVGDSVTQNSWIDFGSTSNHLGSNLGHMMGSGTARYTWYKDGRMLTPTARIAINGE